MTGTTATYSYSAAGSATDVENFERLGQKIHPHDSEDYEPPLNGGLVGSADDTEWQCKASAQFWGGENGGFSDLPWHCQKRMLQDIATPLKDTFGWGGKEESAANVSILLRKSLPPSPHDTGPDNGWTYAANSMRSAALKSTAKDDDDDEPIRIETRVPRWQFDDLDRFDASHSGDGDSSSGGSRQTTSCDISVRGGDGERLNPNDKLGYPNHNWKPNAEGTKNEFVLGMVDEPDRLSINVAIEGHGRGSSTPWVLRQSAYGSDYESGVYFVGKQRRTYSRSKRISKPNDDPLPAYLQLGPGDNIFSHDSPGIRFIGSKNESLETARKLTSGVYKLNLTTTISTGKGRNRVSCSVKWHIEIRYKNGRLTSYSFGLGRY